jgi:hypothetical protein
VGAGRTVGVQQGPAVGVAVCSWELLVRPLHAAAGSLMVCVPPASIGCGGRLSPHMGHSDPAVRAPSCARCRLCLRGRSSRLLRGALSHRVLAPSATLLLAVPVQLVCTVRGMHGASMLRCSCHVLTRAWLGAQCDEDMRTWWPKLRPGGIMAGHDYVSALEGESSACRMRVH